MLITEGLLSDVSVSHLLAHQLEFKPPLHGGSAYHHGSGFTG